MSPAFVQSLLRGFNHMRRGGEVGFADFQMYDVASGRLEFFCANENFERRFYIKPGHPFCKFHMRSSYGVIACRRAPRKAVRQRRGRMRTVLRFALWTIKTYSLPLVKKDLNALSRHFTGRSRATKF